MGGHPSHQPAAARNCVAALFIGAWGLATVAHAGCFDVQVPEYRELRPLVGQNSQRALTEVNARIAALPRNAASQEPRTVAALYAVRARAYGQMTLTHPERAAALAGLALLHDPTDPLRLELLSSYGDSFSSTAAITSALTQIKQARALVRPGSRSDLCLQISEGFMNLLRDRLSPGIREFTQAYMQSGSSELPQAQVAASVGLAVALRYMGDGREALSLIDRQIRWDQAHHETDALAGGIYFKGEILRSIGHYHQAIAAFKQSRAMSLAVDDVQSTGYTDLRMCEAEISLRHFSAARRACNRAAPVLTAGHVTGMIKETRVQLAKIDLAEGHPARSVKALDQVLHDHGADMIAFTIAPAYFARAEANAALHRYADAYRDLSTYLRMYKARNRINQSRLRTALEVRFQAKQEFERNAILRRKLQAAAHRATKQRQLMDWMEAAGVAGALAIALLSYILVADRRHRRQLVVLANEDPLTRLPNRGRTAQLATEALAAACAQSRPLTVALIDFDYFKAINDRCGHAVGDHVLKEFAQLSRGALRTGDIFGRWGGEEFLLVLPDAALDSALASVERLRLLALGIQIPCPDGRTEGLRVTFSAGLASTADGLRTLDEIVARADAALYEAKDAGRDGVRISSARAEHSSEPLRA
ncbi:MAG: GGDEF domain-containing protein [Steroidobacteraceae bacterium]